MLFNKHEGTPEEMFLQVSVYTMPEDFTVGQKTFVKRIFRGLLINLLATDVCLAIVLIFQEVIFAIPGLYFAVKAIMGMLTYFRIVNGEGLRTVMLVFDKLIRIIDHEGNRDIPYSAIESGAVLKEGLVLNFKDGGSFFADTASLLKSGVGPQIILVLIKKLGKRFKNTFDSEELKQEALSAEAEEAKKRFDMLGSRIAEVVYEPDNKDCRDYCRLIFSNGRAKSFITYSVAFLAAVTTALPIVSLITDLYVLETLAFIPLILLLGLLAVSKLGITAPGKKKFVDEIGKTGGKWAIYIHENGICAVMNDTVEFQCRWSGFKECLYDENIGIALESKENDVIFIPADTVYDGTAEFIVSCMERREEHGEQ